MTYDQYDQDWKTKSKVQITELQSELVAFFTEFTEVEIQQDLEVCGSTSTKTNPTNGIVCKNDTNNYHTSQT